MGFVLYLKLRFSILEMKKKRLHFRFSKMKRNLPLKTTLATNARISYFKRLRIGLDMTFRPYFSLCAFFVSHSRGLGGYEE
jgi:hypothetical protein